MLVDSSIVTLVRLKTLLWFDREGVCDFKREDIMRRLSLFLTLMLACLFSASHAENLAAKQVRTTKIHQAPKAHRLLIQVDQNDPAVMNLALNNATNVIEYYRAKGEEVNVDVVTYGPGLHMLRADTSPVQDRIKNLKDIAFPSKIQFSACNNTKEGMEKKEGHPVNVLSEATIVPSGVVRLMELQEKGWSYVRP
jgi:intracellular sulfur oxidation DsrE/DsrF family protein